MRTCATPAHRQQEVQKREHGQAIFRLKQRLEARASAALARSAPTARDAVDVLDRAEVVDELDDLDAHPPSRTADAKKSKKQKTSLTRRWTYNEQLMVRCCGIIVSRATFYEAESPSNVVVSFPY